jgi:phosphoribosylformylglycinamidine (FGAM) synthase-like enzyme
MPMTSKTPQSDPVVTPELVKQHGLTPEEFERIKKILGREPNFTELGIFSVCGASTARTKIQGKN